MVFSLCGISFHFASMFFKLIVLAPSRTSWKPLDSTVLYLWGSHVSCMASLEEMSYLIYSSWAFGFTLYLSILTLHTLLRHHSSKDMIPYLHIRVYFLHYWACLFPEKVNWCSVEKRLLWPPRPAVSLHQVLQALQCLGLTLDCEVGDQGRLETRWDDETEQQPPAH